MIKAVIFDCFGVLVTEAWTSFKHENFVGRPELFKQVTELNHQADGGLISREQFIKQVAAMAEVPESEVLATLINNAPNEPLFEYIKQLKKDYLIGVLSNTSANRLSSLFNKQQLDLFDEAVLSVESGFVKPHPGAYEAIANKLGVSVEEAVFIDDQERHCQGARDAGMQAILYQDFEQMKAELEEILAADAES